MPCEGGAALAGAAAIGNNARMGSALRTATCLLALLLGACASGPDSRMLDRTLYAYAGAIRWGEFDTALGFVEPEYRRAHPLTALEQQRFKQVGVSGYAVKEMQLGVEGEVRQVVEIRVFNRHTHAERAIIDRQTWRWDAQAERWWLTTGLPDLGAGGP